MSVSDFSQSDQHGTLQKDRQILRSEGSSTLEELAQEAPDDLYQNDFPDLDLSGEPASEYSYAQEGGNHQEFARNARRNWASKLPLGSQPLLPRSQPTKQKNASSAAERVSFQFLAQQQVALQQKLREVAQARARISKIKAEASAAKSSIQQLETRQSKQQVIQSQKLEYQRAYEREMHECYKQHQKLVQLASNRDNAIEEAKNERIRQIKEQKYREVQEFKKYQEEIRGKADQWNRETYEQQMSRVQQFKKTLENSSASSFRSQYIEKNRTESNNLQWQELQEIQRQINQQEDFLLKLKREEQAELQKCISIKQKRFQVASSIL